MFGKCVTKSILQFIDIINMNILLQIFNIIKYKKIAFDKILITFTDIINLNQVPIQSFLNFILYFNIILSYNIYL